VTEGEQVGERVVVRRVIRALPEKVFSHWTDPDQLRRWWGPGGFTCPEATVDLRPGGVYRLVMQTPGDGPFMSVTGTYHRIDRPSLLVYTWRWDSGPAASNNESLVTVTFDAHGEGHTVVTVIHDRFASGHDLSPYRSGWEEGLAKLDAMIEGGVGA
jgi:uncharacterized protein YndB with AHSA1/START domain